MQKSTKGEWGGKWITSRNNKDNEENKKTKNDKDDKWE